MSTIFTGRATAIDTGELSRHRVASPLRKALESKADVGDRSAEGQIAGARTPAVRAQSLAKKRTPLRNHLKPFLWRCPAPFGFEIED
jgi:hypothetical protein